MTAPFLRSLKVFAIDPTFTAAWNKTSVDVINGGPRRFVIDDTDDTTGLRYQELKLDTPEVMIGGGLDHDESDPRFHQQMVHAVCLRTLDFFDRSLGRTISTVAYTSQVRKRSSETRLVDQADAREPRSPWILLVIRPHAYYGANAYYDADANEIGFGYFMADPDLAGSNLPGQTIYTCLSFDVIVHELTHALLHQLKPLYRFPTNPHVSGFHEGFADIVALFQHFIDPAIVRAHLLENGARLDRGVLAHIASQVGHGMGLERSLRSGIADESLRLNAVMSDPHELGTVLVAAVFDTFVSVYLRSVTALSRLIGTQGPAARASMSGELPFELATQLANEASNTARTILNMCIRAVDYMPPIDPEFGHFLRAIITVDSDLHPVDRFGFRTSFLECFRARAIFPTDAISFFEASVRWPRSSPARDPLAPALPESMAELTWVATTTALRATDRAGEELPATGQSTFDLGNGRRMGRGITEALAGELESQARRLLQIPGTQRVIAVSYDPTFRVSTAGRVLPEWIAQFLVVSDEADLASGGLPAMRGVTLITDLDGAIRYEIESGGTWSLREQEIAARRALMEENVPVAWSAPVGIGPDDPVVELVGDRS